MRNYLFAGLAVATLVTSAVVVSAAPVAASSSKCHADRVVAMKDMTIRQGPKWSSTVLGTFPKGKTATCRQDYIAGDKYPSCYYRNQEESRWTFIKYGRTSGYVPTLCTRLSSTPK